MDKVFFTFPLCLLTISTVKEKVLASIISYCLVEKALSYKYDVDDLEILGHSVWELESKYPDYFNDNPLHNKLIKAADFFKVTLGSFNSNISRHKTVLKYISDYQTKYGKDSYSAIDKELLFECRDRGFSYELFTILCAINSIIGKKKKFVRITYDRIRYAMNGYRSKTIYQSAGVNLRFLTDRQLKQRIDLLNAKKFFSKFTYQHRQVFFSTRLNDEQLREAVKTSKIFWAKKKLQLADHVYSNEIKDELDKLSVELEAVRNYKRIKLERNKLRLLGVN
jgi:hypothetical protein